MLKYSIGILALASVSTLAQQAPMISFAEAVASAMKKAAEESAANKASIKAAEDSVAGVRSSMSALSDRLKELEARPNVSAPSAPSRPSAAGYPGYLTARTWTELVAGLRSQPVLIDSAITVTSSETLSGNAIRFSPRGSLKLNGKHVLLNCAVINEENRQIFFDYKSNEGYPNRWSNKATSIEGNFGGENRRDARWWGVTTTTNPRQATKAQAEANNKAIAAAALSAYPKNWGGAQLHVQLPSGDIPIYRTIRLDGIRCHLQGFGMNGTRLWAESQRFEFNASHKINTEDFPKGSSPVIEIGYEAQPHHKHPDEGFLSGVKGVGIICPVDPRERVSGIMWVSGLQEGSLIEDVNVQHHSGMAIGGPRKQPLSLNPPKLEGYYNQVNGMKGRNWWIFAPNQNFNDVIGISIGGITFDVDTVTVDQGSGMQTKPAVIVGARENGHLRNFHIEYGPHASASECVGIYIPNDGGKIQRIALTGIGYWPSPPFRPEVKHYTVKIESSGSVSCRTITQVAGEKYGHAIWDVWRSKKSTGSHFPTGSSCIAQYDRDANYSRVTRRRYFTVSTTDPALK